MKIKKKIKKKSGSKTEILRNTEAQPKQLVSYKKKECIYVTHYFISVHAETTYLLELFILTIFPF